MQLSIEPCSLKRHNLDSSILKEFADDNLKYVESGRKLSIQVENTEGKDFVLQTHENQGLFGKGLTLYHTILTFNDAEEEGFGKHCGKRRTCW